MTTRSYLDYLDLSKGIGILLVIIGHGILSNFGINVFHMPLLFFLTGLTFALPNLININIFIIKKINRIVIPWIFFSVISAMIEIVVSKLNPAMPFNGPLWFLQTLILALSIYTILRMAINREYILHLLVALLPIIVFSMTKYTTIPSILPFNLSRALMAVFYVHLGSCFKQYFKWNEFKHLGLLLFVSALYFLGLYLSVHYYDNQEASFINTRAYMYNLPLSLFTSISGILMIVFFCMLIKKIRFINWLWINSLVIMCVHFPLQKRLNQVCFYCFTELHVSSLPIKLTLVLISYAVTLVFCVLAILLCKRYLPKLTGYDNLIPIA